MMILAYLTFFWILSFDSIPHSLDITQYLFFRNELVIEFDDQPLLMEARLNVVDSGEFILQTFQMQHTHTAFHVGYHIRFLNHH